MGALGGIDQYSTAPYGGMRGLTCGDEHACCMTRGIDLGRERTYPEGYNLTLSVKAPNAIYACRKSEI